MSSVPSHDEAITDASSTTRDLEKAVSAGSRLTNRKRGAAENRVKAQEEVEVDSEDDYFGRGRQESHATPKRGQTSRVNSIWSSGELDRLINGEDLDLETYQVTEL